jgi:tetratricopeptide (TPR) repeat protein
MASSSNRCAGRAFHQVLEEMPPSRRFLLAANPPARANSSDIRFFVDKSYGLRYSDGPSMYHYSKLACTLADAIRIQDAGTYDAKGQAWMQFGNVLRIYGQLPGSRDAFGTAEAHLSLGSMKPDLQALLWEFRGSLYRDWRKFEQAEECLATAAVSYVEAVDLTGSDRCTVSCALCAGKGGEPERAVRLAESAVRRIDPVAQPHLAVAAVHALCWYLVDAGDPELALVACTEADFLFDALPDELIQAHRSWLRAHIDYALQHHSAAESLYRRAARAFAKHEISYELALVLLDLCLPLAAQHRLGELAAVASEIIPEFERLGIGREATASRLLLSAARQASLTERLKDLARVSRLVQGALPPARQLPKI